MLIKCKACKGTGQIPINIWDEYEVCKVCNGKGGFDINDDKELCPKCKGNGKVYVPTYFGSPIEFEFECEICSGLGVIDKENDNK